MSHPSRAWQDKGGPFLTPDQRRQAAIFDEPGRAAQEWPPGAAAGEPAGGLLQQPPADNVEQRAREVAAPLREHRALADVTARQGRRVSDRLAHEAQDRLDRVESSAAMSEAAPRDDWWRQPRAVPKTEERRREIQTAAQPRAGDYPGRGQEVDDYEHQAWLRHFADAHDLHMDDLQRDLRCDTDFGIPQEDLHYRSPDLDELLPRQRGDDTGPPDWWGADYPTAHRSADDADVQ